MITQIIFKSKKRRKKRCDKHKFWNVVKWSRGGNSTKMAARGGRRAARVVKKVVEKVNHPPYMKVTIPAGQAAAAPPLGPQLGQVCLILYRKN